jgi:hypothetical protein
LAKAFIASHDVLLEEDILKKGEYLTQKKEAGEKTMDGGFI